MNRRSPHSFTHRQVIDEILNKLAEAEQPLPSHLELYRQILIEQSKIKLPVLSPRIATLKQKAAQRMAQGKPSLAFSELTIDWADIQTLLNEVIRLTEEYLSPTSEEIKELNQISVDPALQKKAALAWFGTGTVSHKNVTKSQDLKPLTGSVLQALFNPLLAAHADELLPLVNQETWYKRYCPVCGGNPDFAFLDKDQGGRHLLCSRCDAQWLFYRLTCPYCENDDHSTLAYFTDDESLYRLYVCEKCRRYIKTIDLRKTKSEILLPLERVLTLDMDRQACESNYKATD